MQHLEFRYKKSRINFNLIFIIAGLLFFGSFLYFGRENQLFGYGWLVISILYTIAYFRQKKYPYVVITPATIEINEPFRKGIVNKKELTEVRKFADTYKLQTGRKKYSINLSFVESETKDALDRELQKLI